MAKKTFEERAKELKAKLGDCLEKIKPLEAEIAARKRDGAIPPKVAEEKLVKLIGQRKLVLSQMSLLERAQESHGKYVLGAILKNLLDDRAVDPLLLEKVLEALMRDNRAARNSDLVRYALRLHRDIYPDASLDEVYKWALRSKDYLWVRPRAETKKQEPRSATPAQQPVKPPEPAAPVVPEDPIERAKKDPVYRREFTTRLKEQWSKTFASNQWVQSQELSYWQSEMSRLTEMFEHSTKSLDAEEAKLREELKMQKGIFKGARREQIEEQIRDIDRQRGLSIQAHERSLESFKEKSSPERIRKKVFSDTKGQRPELFAQMSALGIAPG